jgi:hypothetical protein
MSHRQGTMSNRRKLERIATRMPAQVRRLSGWWRRGQQGVWQVLDYNRLGAGLVSTRPMPLGTRLLLDLNAGHFVLRKLPAEVVSCTREAGQYRIGVRFYRHQGELSGEHSAVFSVLSGLEDSLMPEPLGS